MNCLHSLIFQIFFLWGVGFLAKIRGQPAAVFKFLKAKRNNVARDRKRHFVGMTRCCPGDNQATVTVNVEIDISMRGRRSHRSSTTARPRKSISSSVIVHVCIKKKMSPTRHFFFQRHLQRFILLRDTGKHIRETFGQESVLKHKSLNERFAFVRLVVLCQKLFTFSS